MSTVVPVAPAAAKKVVTITEEMLDMLRTEVAEYKSSYQEAQNAIEQLRGNAPRSEDKVNIMTKSLHGALLKGKRLFLVVQDMIDKMPESLLCKRAHPNR
jgi:signal recognition particle GTPase